MFFDIFSENRHDKAEKITSGDKKNEPIFFALMNNHFTIFRCLYLNFKANREMRKNGMGLYIYSIKLKQKRFY